VRGEFEVRDSKSFSGGDAGATQKQVRGFMRGTLVMHGTGNIRMIPLPKAALQHVNCVCHFDDQTFYVFLSFLLAAPFKYLWKLAEDCPRT
jgi:hypothetical protein